MKFAKLLGLLFISWFAMTWTHELGHVTCGAMCGGKLESLDLWPWHFPHSTFNPDPIPLVTLWGGPMLGVLVPLSIASILRKPSGWFIYHFCSLANGSYLAVSWFMQNDPLLDSQRLLNAGAWSGSILTFCFLTIGISYIPFRNQCKQLLAPKGNEPPVSKC